VPIASAVKVTLTETVAGAAPQMSKLFFLEIFKEFRKVRNDRGIPSGRNWPNGMKKAIKNASIDTFKRKDKRLGQDREPRRGQKSNCDPPQKWTILITKTQQSLQKVIFTNDRKGFASQNLVQRLE
jgi:hypothetical protein